MTAEQVPRPRLAEGPLAAARWFHSIDFGEFASSGRFPPGDPQNVTLFGAMDVIADIGVAGADVLDIGAVDGLMSFGLRALGANRVVATDSVVRDTFLLARDALGLEVEYLTRRQLRDLAELLGPGSFDLVLCAGVIYHMLNPASAFFECRKLVKEGGLVIFESHYDRKSDRAAIFVNSEEELSLEPNTYSMPTRRAMLGLMRLALFDVLAVRTLVDPDRITVLGRAVAPDGVGGATTLTRRIHELDFCDFEYQIKRCWPSPANSTIEYRGDGGEVVIDQRLYRPSFPFHPPLEKRTVGSTAWTTATGNR